MKRIKRYLYNLLNSLSLSTKLTVLLMAMVLLPLICMGVYHFSNMRQSLYRRHDELAKTVLQRSMVSTGEALEACYAAAGSVLYDELLLDELTAPSPGEDHPRRRAAVLEGIVRVNPTIHAVRLYLNDHGAGDDGPFVYRMERMREQAWYSDPIPLGNAWQFNAPDRAFSPRSDETYAVLLNELKDPQGKPLGVLEVSANMKAMFWDMYHLEQTQWMGFVDSTGALIYDKDRELGEWGNVIGSVAYTAWEGGGGYTSSLVNIGPHSILVARVREPRLSGRIIYASMLDAELRSVNQLQFIFTVILIVFSLLSAVFMNRAVRRMLERFYTLMGIAEEVQRGNLSVTVPDMGQDEIGQFAGNFRETIERIRVLLKTSVSRELLVKTTEIRALQNQINSHFIYNVLESIKMMAEIDGKFAISDAVTSLGKLLRYSMKWAASMVTVEEELDYIQHYIALLNLRYDFAIVLDLLIPPALLEQKIPKMSLQPIVENAVFHGIEELEEDAVIRINAKECGDYFDVEISDTGKGMDQEQLMHLRQRIYGMVKDEGRSRGGIGLRNVQERIQLCFGSGYGLRIYSKERCFTKVIVKIPLEGKETADGKAVDC